MAQRRGSAEQKGSTDQKSMGSTATELWALLKDYARQETVDPLKNLGRFLAFGVAGSLLLGVGVLLLTMAVLRALQAETGSNFTGNLSWIPYLITLAVATVAIVLALRAIKSPKKERA